MLIRLLAKIEVRREAKDADGLVFVERCMIPPTGDMDSE